MFRVTILIILLASGCNSGFAAISADDSQSNNTNNNNSNSLTAKSNSWLKNPLSFLPPALKTLLDNFPQSPSFLGRREELKKDFDVANCRLTVDLKSKYPSASSVAIFEAGQNIRLLVSTQNTTSETTPDNVVINVVEESTNVELIPIPSPCVVDPATTVAEINDDTKVLTVTFKSTNSKVVTTTTARPKADHDTDDDDADHDTDDDTDDNLNNKNDSAVQSYFAADSISITE